MKPSAGMRLSPRAPTLATILVIAAALAMTVPISASSAYLRGEQRKIVVAGRTFSVSLIRVPLSSYRLKVGLASGRVGGTEPLAAIARREGALAGINGCFFNAYTSDSIKAPYHHIITDGQLVHLGNTGTTLGFDPAGGYRMERVNISVLGGLDGRWTYPDNWYAYFMNHPVESSSAAVIYTTRWPLKWTPAQGAQVVVRRGIVQAVGGGPHVIPVDGFVLAFAGRERYLAARFTVGRRVAYRLAIRAGDPEFWSRAAEALECGPRLLQAGAERVDARSEGFSHPKIVSLEGRRSAIGITADQTVLLMTTGNATEVQLARVMKTLGARDAMNLDGGASSGLWVQGAYLTSPGRDISHALLVLKRP